MIVYTIIIFLLMSIIYKLYQKYTCGMCVCETRLDGKTAIVTGANSGIGFQTAQELARRGARVIITCRDTEMGLLTRRKIVQETGNENVVFRYLDLVSLKSVSLFAENITMTEPNLHILINNAGTGKLDNSLTEDKLPIEVQVNYFGPYLLTMILLPLLKKSAPSRIVNVSAVMHWFGNINLETFHKQAANVIQHSRVYSNTKLANIVFTTKLNSLLMGTRVTANSLHPGAVATDIFRNKSSFTRFLIKMLFKTPWEGAQTSIHLSVSPELETVSGKYFSNCVEARMSKTARDCEFADKFYDYSWKMMFSGKRD